VLGDDLALSAQQVAGIRADRELPVVWAVALGSLRNKAILVPAALAISAFAPWMVMLLLMLGGAFLCYEGFEKLAERFLHGKEVLAARHGEHVQALVNPAVDMLAFEKDKIRVPCAPTSFFPPRSLSSPWAPWRVPPWRSSSRY
jgi:predicted DNA repair protein MutK